jgi:hypothetical protein
MLLFCANTVEMLKKAIAKSKFDVFIFEWFL